MERNGLKLLVVSEEIGVDHQTPWQNGNYHPLHLDAEEGANVLTVLCHIIDDSIVIRNATQSAAATLRERDELETGGEMFCLFRTTEALANRIERYADLLFSELGTRRMGRPETPPQTAEPGIGDVARTIAARKGTEPETATI